jgi:hypothetical protein
LTRTDGPKEKEEEEEEHGLCYFTTFGSNGGGVDATKNFEKSISDDQREKEKGRHESN